MTEEQALDIWRSLTPFDARLHRTRRPGPGDPAAFEVVVTLRGVSGKNLYDILKFVNEENLDIRIDLSPSRQEKDIPFLVIFDPGEPLVHPATPKA